MTKSPATYLMLVAASLLGGVARPHFSSAAEIDFEREIRPILAEKCLLCHGPDDTKGGLRLTGLDFASKALESGHRGVVPGKPDESALVARIYASDPDDIMPPPNKAEPLTVAEKAKLKQWIGEGATTRASYEWPARRCQPRGRAERAPIDDRTVA